MRKEDKGNIIAQLGEVLNEYAHFYLVDVTGLNAATTSAMRRKCFQSEIKMVVAVSYTHLTLLTILLV